MLVEVDVSLTFSSSPSMNEKRLFACETSDVSSRRDRSLSVQHDGAHASGIDGGEGLRLVAGELGLPCLTLPCLALSHLAPVYGFAIHAPLQSEELTVQQYCSTV